jgi:LPS-assembly lipoprotein
MRSVSIVASVIFALFLAGCGFQPLYNTASSGNQVEHNLASITVAEPQSRLDQLIRNEVIASISPPGSAGGSAYRLEIHSKADEFTSIENINTEPSRLQYKVNTSYTLYDNQTGKPMHNGKTFSHVSYDRVDAPAANLQALNNAQERAAREIGQDIRLRLAAYFAKNGSS